MCALNSRYRGIEVFEINIHKMVNGFVFMFNRNQNLGYN